MDDYLRKQDLAGARTPDDLDRRYNFRALRKTVGDLVNAMHPVGSVYISSVNENPSDLIGGKWSLVKKEFTDLYKSSEIADDGCPFEPSDIVSECKVYVVRSGQTIRLSLRFKTSEALGEADKVLGTLDWNALGVTDICNSFTGAFASSDDANAILQITVNYSSGVVSFIDSVPKADGGTITAGSEIFFSVTFNVDSSRMIDSHCDKFYWKRTA